MCVNAKVNRNIDFELLIIISSSFSFLYFATNRDAVQWLKRSSRLQAESRSEEAVVI
jgi:hypothetical protein